MTVADGTVRNKHVGVVVQHVQLHSSLSGLILFMSVDTFWKRKAFIVIIGVFVRFIEDVIDFTCDITFGIIPLRYMESLLFLSPSTQKSHICLKSVYNL